MTMGNRENKKHNQKQLLLELLDNREEVLTTEEAAVALNVSESTVRRIFNELEEKGEVTRVYGGIIYPRDAQNEYWFDKLKSKRVEEKQRIGIAASKLINSGDTLFIDSGTTAQQVAIGLVSLLKKKNIENIQVFTNSMINVEILADYCNVSLLGGLYRKNRQDFSGYITDIVLDVISFDKSFIGADAVYVDIDGGGSASDAHTAQISRKVVGRTKTNYLIVDSTKFNKRSLIEYISMKHIDTIITDTGLSDEVAMAVINSGPRLIRA